MPRPKKNVYIVGDVCFVPHPAAHGLWVRTDVSVAKAACPVCGSGVGVPCQSARVGRFSGSTHYRRRNAARDIVLPEGERTTIVMELKRKP